MKAASSIFTALSAAVFGFFIGISFPVEITPKVSKYIPYIHVQYICLNLLDGSIFIYIYICACSFSIVPFSLATVQTRTPAPAVTATTTCSTSGHHPSETALVPRRMPLFQGTVQRQQQLQWRKNRKERRGCLRVLLSGTLIFIYTASGATQHRYMLQLYICIMSVYLLIDHLVHRPLVSILL
jgi:hypothetical protein